MKYIIEDVISGWWSAHISDLIGKTCEVHPENPTIKNYGNGYVSVWLFVEDFKGTLPDGSCFFSRIKLKPISDNCQEPQAQGFCAKTGDSSPSLKRESNMGIKTNRKVTTSHHINGRNVKDMNQSEMIDEIRQAEADIVTLKSVKTESAAVTRQIKNLKAFTRDVVTHLDKK